MLHVISRNDGSAIEAACAQVAREFGPGYEARDLKERIGAVLKGEVPDREIRFRYGERAQRVFEGVLCWRASNEIGRSILISAGIAPLPEPTLAIAINLIERQYRLERNAHRAAAARRYSFGTPQPSRLSLSVLAELRLILRFLRRRSPERFPAILADFAR